MSQFFQIPPPWFKELVIEGIFPDHFKSNLQAVLQYTNILHYTNRTIKDIIKRRLF